jgi:hypothetical protein
MDEIESFTIALEKILNREVISTFWSPSMDLMSIIYKGNILEV